ncbi:sulfatase-like hydrolase/transferase [Thalassotalea sp. PLHSN55]|uniref:sulfatase-like hydrolase/transferase n=1 Tax=Thalassotalea sp. PLHSN55 TaxID=3435888 RepID=UPI003F829592
MSLILIVACGGGNESSNNDNNSDENSQPPQSTNAVPVAQAGGDQQASIGDLIVLDGSNSSDLDNEPLTYQWTFQNKPNTSNAQLSSNNEMITSFTIDVDGEYVVGLVVDDGTESSELDIVIVSSNSAKNYAIVDTNQTRCFSSVTGAEQVCSGEGVDADHQGNNPSYSLSNDGLIVIDNITGLVWQQSSDIDNDGQLNYADKLLAVDAAQYCDDLSYGGRDDWRLPSIKESYSLIDFSGKDASNYSGTDTSTLTPFIDSVFDWAFGDINTEQGINAGDRIIDGQYASSTQYVSTTMNNDVTTFGVNFVDGRIKGYPTERKKFYVRCVAGNTNYGANQFVANNDATVSDVATGLMWQQQDLLSTNWDDAVSVCQASSTANYSDWRLPNAKELHSLVDYNKSPDTNNSAAIDELFQSSSLTNENGQLDWRYYWSSTTHIDNNDDGSNGVYIAFGRALGYMQDTLLDVHGAGAQRSNDKINIANESGAQSATSNNGQFYYKGPQGDILRLTNSVRCVRNITAADEDKIATNASLNVLLIIADDLGLDNISSYDLQPDFSANTPIIDQLAESGVRFNNAWANPMCSPSRASLLTGKYAFNHNVTHPGGNVGTLSAQEQTIAELIAPAGYQSALFGKWHLGNQAGVYPTDQGFDYYSGSLSNIDNYFNWQKTQITSQGGVPTATSETGYASAVVTQEAAAWINQQTANPWFVQLAFNAPHSPFHVPPESTFNSITLSGVQGDACNGNNNTDDISDCYRATVEALDTYIGELIAAIPTQILENTLIIFVGDNGTPKQAIIEQAGTPFIEEHGKGTVYQGGIQVPLIISATQTVGIDSAVINEQVLIQDIFTTVAEIAGVKDQIAADVEGKSLLGYIDNQLATPEPRAVLYSELYSNSEGIDRWTISNGNIKYINNESVEECYNLEVDLQESSNGYENNATFTMTCDELKVSRPQ